MAQKWTGVVAGDRGAHLLACMAQSQGQLRGDGAFPDPTLSREDKDDMLDAGQVSRLCSEG